MTHNETISTTPQVKINANTSIQNASTLTAQPVGYTTPPALTNDALHPIMPTIDIVSPQEDIVAQLSHDNTRDTSTHDAHVHTDTMTIHGHVAGKPTPVLVDTGASVSAVSAAW